jgi:transposase
MKLQCRIDKRFQIRIRAVEEYLNSGSLEQVASRFNVHSITLRRWIERYRKGGKDALKRKETYARHPKRLPVPIEKKIAFLKENNPCLTLLHAQNIIKKDNIKISLEGIRAIWKRYNLTGFRNDDYQPGGEIAIPEVQDSLEKAEQALDKDDTRKAARILNILPSCQGQDILKKIPDRYLSLQRKVEKLLLTFNEIPFHETLREARVLRRKAESKGLIYTAVRAGLAELFAMDWMDKSHKQLVLVRKLGRKTKRKTEGRNNIEPILRFRLLMLECRALAKLGRTRESIDHIGKCENLYRHQSNSIFYSGIASFYSAIGFNKKVRKWLEKGLKCSKIENEHIPYSALASNYVLAGEYNLTKKFLGKIDTEKYGLKPLAAIIKAQCHFAEGMLHDAMDFADIALKESKKEAIPQYFWSSSFVLASCLCGFNERKKAMNWITSVLPILRKFTIKDSVLFAEILLRKKKPKEESILKPPIRLAVLLSKASKSLKIIDYRKAFHYATSQQLMGLFHRSVLFFPESVNKLISKGKSTGLPKALLKLPIFQKNIPVFHLRFLGPVYIHRNGVKLRHDPTPIYASILIHLCFKKKVELESLYANFWRKAKNPRGSLSHLLFGLRKYLRFPPYTLFTKERFLHFKGYVTTDYQYYKETIIRAKALERAGEWGFAKREYLRAFALFRGEPFKKMYDNWSEEMRRVILNKLETEALHFAKSYLENNNEIRQEKRRTPKGAADVRKVLEKVLKIIPQSEESAKILQTL